MENAAGAQKPCIRAARLPSVPAGAGGASAARSGPLGGLSSPDQDEEESLSSAARAPNPANLRINWRSKVLVSHVRDVNVVYNL